MNPTVALPGSMKWMGIRLSSGSRRPQSPKGLPLKIICNSSRDPFQKELAHAPCMWYMVTTRLWRRTRETLFSNLLTPAGRQHPTRMGRSNTDFQLSNRSVLTEGLHDARCGSTVSQKLQARVLSLPATHLVLMTDCCATPVFSTGL